MVKRIHNVLGTPSHEKLLEFQAHASHIEIKFSHKEGTGIDKLIPNVSELCRDLIKKLLTYDSNQRITSTQALNHPYFKDIATQFRSTQSLHSKHEVFNNIVIKDEKKSTKKILPLIGKIKKHNSNSKFSHTNSEKSPNAKIHFPSMKTHLSPYGQKLLVKHYY